MQNQLKDLPFELIEHILQYFSLYQCKLVGRRLSQRWRKAANNVLAIKFRGYIHLLNNIGKPADTITNALDSNRETPFKTWILCNLEYPPDSNVLSAIEIMISHYDINRCQLNFVPSGFATFGMWVEHVGFFPITAPYQLSTISWLPKIEPMFRIWTRIDEKAYPDVEILLNQPNTTSQLPKSRIANNADHKLGEHRLKLFDDFGPVAEMKYTVMAEEKTANLPTSLSGVNLLLNHLEQEENKISATIDHVFVDPQVFLSMPL